MSVRPMAAAKGFFSRHGEVFYYVPNIIGYVRVLCTAYSYVVALSRPQQCVLFYFISFVLDELDGRFARMLNQASTFGAVLDMVTDRVATSGLLAILCILYPSWHGLFLALLALDIFSHWFQMYASLACGAHSHKDVSSRSWLIRMYYKHRLFMGFCCVCVEVLYLSLYALHWTEMCGWRLQLPLPRPIIDAGKGAMEWLGQGSQDSRLALQGQQVSVALVVGVLAFPGFVVKQLVNLKQLTTAARTIVEQDCGKKC